MVTKYEALANTLRQLIRGGEVKVGDCLPSQAELMRVHGLSLVTVRQALALLAREGLVRPEHGRGVVVIGDQPGMKPSGRRLGLAVWDHMPRDPSALMILDGMSEVVAERDAGLLFAAFDSREPWQAERLRRFGRACWAMVISGIVDEHLLDLLEGLGIPLVLAGHGTDDGVEQRLPCIAFDAETAGYMAAQMLCMHGHRRIALHLSCRYTTYQHRLEAGFLRACRESARDGVVWVGPEETAVAELVDRGSGVTGLVVMGDPVACACIEALRRQGVGVPEEVSVVAIGSRPRDDLAVPELSRLAFSCQDLGRQCATILLDPEVRRTRRQLPPRVEMGQTVRAPARTSTQEHADESASR